MSDDPLNREGRRTGPKGLPLWRVTWSCIVEAGDATEAAVKGERARRVLRRVKRIYRLRELGQSHDIAVDLTAVIGHQSSAVNAQEQDNAAHPVLSGD